VKIPLIGELTTASLPEGSMLLVEFDPASQWYNASLTIVAAWLEGGGGVSYSVASQSPDTVRLKLKRLGLDVEGFEKDDKLRIWDWYTATLGQKSKEKFSMSSLRVSDLSIYYSQQQIRGPPIPNRLDLIDDGSVIPRFNDEKSWVEFLLTRVYPMAKSRKSTIITSVIKGVHSDWAYKRLEAAADGIIDFKLEETGEETRDLIRIKSMKDSGFDRKWHLLTLGDTLRVRLEK
jgi:KaiC/GvpD/RAD55 family RecA-like ATPase